MKPMFDLLRSVEITRRDRAERRRGPKRPKAFAVESLELRDCPTVTFLDFQESSPTDALPLIGTTPTTVTPTSLLFTPNGFQSASNPLLSNDTTVSLLSFTIDADPGKVINTITFELAGDASIAGNPLTSSASAGVSANVFIEVTEINGVTTTSLSRSLDLVFNPNDGQFSLAQDGIVVGKIYDGTVIVDVDDILADNSVLGKASIVKVRLTTLLDTDAGTQGSSFIQLKTASTVVNTSNAPVLGSIGDTVFYDTDNSGTESAGDTPIAGVVVNLRGAGFDGIFNTADDILLQDVTDANGHYLFENLNLGAYRVTVDTSSAPLFGLANTADPDGVKDSTSLVTIDLNTPNNLLQDFGYRAVGVIGDTIFRDNDVSGTESAGDTPIAGVSVELRFAGVDGQFDTADDVLFNDVTDANGHYLFENLLFGNYRVTVDTNSAPLVGLFNTADPDGGNDSKSQLTITVGNPVNLLQDFGYNNTTSNSEAALSGIVYVDLNNNGIVDGNEVGIPGVTLQLFRAGQATPVGQTVTDAAGFYSFVGLIAGTYRVIETQPDGYTDGLDTVGTLGGNNNTNDQLGSIVVPTNSIGVGYNFGELGITNPTKRNFLASSSTLNFANVLTSLQTRFGANAQPLVDAFLNPTQARQDGFDAGDFINGMDLALALATPQQSARSRDTSGVGNSQTNNLALIDEALDSYDLYESVADVDEVWYTAGRA